jgi:tetratricopeptide (TPR) repeat protein
MATVLSRAGGDKDKIQARCRAALELDKDNWRASAFLARWLDSKKDGIALLEKLVSRYKGDAAWMAVNREELAEMAYALGHLNWAEKQLDKAKKWYSASLEYGPTKYNFLPQILRRYYSVQWWNEMIAIIEQLHSKSHLAPAMVAMTKGHLNDEVQRGILQAGINANKLDVFDHVYPDAIKFAAKAGDHPASFNLRETYASALSARHPPPTEDILKLLEAAAGDVPYTNTDLAATFFHVGYKLGTIYLGKAKEARKAGQDIEAKEWLHKMSTVVPEEVTENQMRLPLSLFAARFYYINNDLEAARSMAHNTLRMAIELLSDGDSTNDELAYKKILYAVIPFKDEVNAAAALAMLKLEAPGGRFSLSCSCSCGHEWSAPGNMWWCMDCINVVLTPKCRDAVKDKSVRSNVCHESHSHFYIPEWDQEKMKNVPKDHVPYNGVNVSMAKWRKELTKAYHLN